MPIARHQTTEVNRRRKTKGAGFDHHENPSRSRHGGLFERHPTHNTFITRRRQLNSAVFARHAETDNRGDGVRHPEALWKRLTVSVVWSGASLGKVAGFDCGRTLVGWPHARL